MLSETNPQALTEAALSEMQSLTLNLYTPMSRQEYERNQAIYERLMAEVLRDEEPNKVELKA